MVWRRGERDARRITYHGGFKDGRRYGQGTWLEEGVIEYQVRLTHGSCMGHASACCCTQACVHLNVRSCGMAACSRRGVLAEWR